MSIAIAVFASSQEDKREVLMMLPTLGTGSSAQQQQPRKSPKLARDVHVLQKQARQLGVVRNSPEMNRKAAWPGYGGGGARLARVASLDESMDCTEKHSSAALGADHKGLKIGDLTQFNMLKLAGKLGIIDDDASSTTSSPPVRRSRGKLRVRLPDIKLTSDLHHGNGQDPWKHVLHHTNAANDHEEEAMDCQPIVGTHVQATGRLTQKQKHIFQFAKRRSQSFDDLATDMTQRKASVIKTPITASVAESEPVKKSTRRTGGQKPYAVPILRRRSSLNSADFDTELLQQSRNQTAASLESFNQQRRASFQSDITNGIPEVSPSNDVKTDNHHENERKKKPRNAAAKRAEKLKNLDLSEYTSITVNNDDCEAVTVSNPDSLNHGGKRTVRFNVLKEVLMYEPSRSLSSKRNKKTPKQVKMPSR